MIQKSNIISEICNSLSSKDILGASSHLQENYPFVSTSTVSRKFTPSQSMEVFIHDGFIDRYTGFQLVFPGVLRLLSLLMPEEFPFHPNWKMSECHMAFWDLFPTIDHVKPIARGGTNEPDNIVCTSMVRNSAKSNYILEEIGWSEFPRDRMEDWDGLTNWFVQYIELNQEHRENKYIDAWNKVAVKAMSDYSRTLK